MAKWTIRWLRKIPPEKRLLWAARLFWLSVLFGTFSIVFFCDNSFERVLMAISWGAITITTVDIVATTDVRNEE